MVCGEGGLGDRYVVGNADENMFYLNFQRSQIIILYKMHITVVVTVSSLLYKKRSNNLLLKLH